LTEANIKGEVQTVMQLNDICGTFKIEENTEKAREIENNLNLREYLDRKPSTNMNIDNNIQNKNRWERFGGKPPFSYLSNEEEEVNLK
jgi:hypothetical protein